MLLHSLTLLMAIAASHVVLVLYFYTSQSVWSSWLEHFKRRKLNPACTTKSTHMSENVFCCNLKLCAQSTNEEKSVILSGI